MPSAYVTGQITVADSVDASSDYSGIEVSIISKDSAEAEADTLFYQVTDSAGTFEGTATFPADRFYILRVDRNRRGIGQTSIILADGDTVSIRAELPGLQQTVEIASNQHEALEYYNRVNRNYQRVMRYIRSGAISGDSARAEIRKWADLHWQVYEERKGTVPARMAAGNAIELYSSLNDSTLMRKLRQIRDNEQLAGLAVRFGKDYLARNRGLRSSLQYLDTLQTITADSSVDMQIRQERIKILYDSARIDAAKSRLEEFKELYGSVRSVRNWVNTIEYDLNYLSPGDAIPAFSFRVNGKLISRDSLLGTPYILEITTLSNRLYQEQYDRTYIIHNIYQNFGLEVVTMPLDQSQVTIDAFFDEREKAWPVASAEAFDAQNLIESFNIRLVPTRFLVDRQGKIVRKYIGREYQDIIQGIQTIIRTEEPAS